MRLFGPTHRLAGNSGRAAAPRRRRLFQGLALIVMTCGGGPLDELPFPAPPPDPLSLLRALQPRVPPGWSLGQPGSYLGIAQVVVNVADEWRGNPLAAAVTLCPDPEDMIWMQLRVFRLVMRYRQRDWPPYECRP